MGRGARRVGRGAVGGGRLPRGSAPERPRRARRAQRALARRRQSCPAPRRGVGGLARPRRPAVEAEGGAPAGRGGGSTRGCRAGPSRVAKAPPSGPCTSCTSCPCALSSDTTHGAVARACWGPTSDRRGPHRSRSTFLTATEPLRRATCARTTRRAPEAGARARGGALLANFRGGDNEPTAKRFTEHGRSGSRDAPTGSGRLPRAAAAPRTAHFGASMRAALEPAAPRSQPGRQTYPPRRR